MIYLCLKCGNVLAGKQTKYCSEKCCSLFLKSEYKKRNKDKINEYNRKIRKIGVRTCGKDLIKRYENLQSCKCWRCGCKNNLEVHHIRPRRFGGSNDKDNLMLLCKKCHMTIENINLRCGYYIISESPPPTYTLSKIDFQAQNVLFSPRGEWSKRGVIN